jgi:hypothetical protein
MCKTLKLGVLVIAMLGIAFLACDKLGVPDQQVPENPGKVTTSTYHATAPLRVGPTTIGYVGVSFTYDFVYIEYVITDATWWMAQNDAHIATTVNGIPHQGGRPLPQQFAYRHYSNPTVQRYMFTIQNRNAWRNARKLYIAAHAGVFQTSRCGGGQCCEDAWAGLEVGDWHFDVPKVPKVLNLPRTMVHSRYSQVTGNIPSQFHVWGIPSATPPYSIGDGYYPSFCLDNGIYIYPQDYNTYLFSSYDPSMPAYAKYLRGTTQPVPYDEMNYLINGIIEGWWETADPLPFTDAHIYALQHIFWHWRGLSITLNSYELALEAEAETNGVGFIPSAGQYMAVLLDNGESVQLCFLVIDP